MDIVACVGNADHPALNDSLSRPPSPRGPTNRALRQAESSLRDSQARSRTIIDNFVDGLITIDQHGSVTSFSKPAERIFGYGADEVIGRNVKLLMPEPYHSGPDGYLESYMRAGIAQITGRVIEVKGRRKDGSIFPVELAVAEIPSEHGTREFVGSVRDITTRRNVAEQLQQAQKMEAIGNLTGGLAHDFNNLLGIIIGSLDLLAPHFEREPQDRELHRDALGAALKGADLTRRLLAFARAQTLQPERIELNALVEEMAKLLSRTLGPMTEISVVLAPDIWPVVADPGQLQSALANLATNARDAMPDGGKLIFATYNRALDASRVAEHAEVAPGDYAVIEVSDTGAGMAREIVTHIFEPFFTTKERGKGTGLGLAMVFGFIKQSDGHINVHSKPGKGTTFCLFLPRATAEAKAAERPRQPIAANAGAGKRVLVAEDDDALRRVVVRQLRDLGYQPLEAASAAAALDILEREPVDLLFSDVIMPGEGDGFELARRVAARWPKLRILLTSGFPAARLSLGRTVRLLHKPYRREELAAALREALASGKGKT
ncbi:MAG TPA: PAS domain S-box protein [Stellaceae bacterium]|nr:PAS domain S-box protein [Stellaceae bacterium]